MRIVKTYKSGSKRFHDDLIQLYYKNQGYLLFLLRHGQIRGHETKRFIGQTDVPLDSIGRNQALSWHKDFSSLNFNRVYSSSLERCKKTAQLICPHHDIHIDHRLNEINMGDWDGKSFMKIKKIRPEAFKKRGDNIYRFKPAKGESFQDLSSRVLPFFNKLESSRMKVKNKSHLTLVVTHAGVIRVFLSHLLHLKPEELFTIKMNYGQLFVVTLQHRYP